MSSCVDERTSLSRKQRTLIRSEVNHIFSLKMYNLSSRGQNIWTCTSAHLQGPPVAITGFSVWNMFYWRDRQGLSFVFCIQYLSPWRIQMKEKKEKSQFPAIIYSVMLLVHEECNCGSLFLCFVFCWLSSWMQVEFFRIKTETVESFFFWKRQWRCFDFDRKVLSLTWCTWRFDSGPLPPKNNTWLLISSCQHKKVSTDKFPTFVSAHVLQKQARSWNLIRGRKMQCESGQWLSGGMRSFLLVQFGCKYLILLVLTRWII